MTSSLKSSLAEALQNPPIDLPKPVGLLFDWDGTLADTLPVIHAAFNATMRHMNHAEISLEELQLGIHRSGRELFPELFAGRAEEAASVYYQTFEELHLEKVQPIEGAERLLQQAQAAGLYLAVVSNKRGTFLRKEVTKLGFDPYFKQVIGAEDAIADKPNPAVIDLALHGSQLPKDQQLWFIGDTITDIHCAHNADLTGILVRNTPMQDGEFAQYPPKYYCANLAALTACLEHCLTV